MTPRACTFIVKSLILFLFFVPASGWSQTDSLVKLMNPSSVALPKGYSHAAIVDLGNCKMVILSGQVALDKQGNLVGKDDFDKQAEQVFENIRNILVAAGGSMNDIVKLGYYVMDVSRIQSLRAIRDRFVNVKNPPASTLVKVAGLFREDILIEIEATAIIPKK